MDPLVLIENRNNSGEINSSLNHNFTSYPPLEIFPEPYLSILVAFFTFTSVAAFLFNLSAITLICSQFRRHQQSRKKYNKQLHQAGKELKQTAKRIVSNTTSGNELRLYLLNLFVNDILLSIISGPVSYIDYIYGQWIFLNFMCPLANFLSVCSVTVSIYTLIAIGLERYIAIIHPLSKDSIFKRYTKLVIVFTWIIGICLAFPAILVNRAVPFKYKHQHLFDCREEWADPTNSKIYTMVIFVFTFMIPLVSLTFLYGSIAKTYFNHVMPGIVDASRDQVQQRQKLKVLRMLIVLVVVFALCWFPIQVYNVVMYFCDDCKRTFAKALNTFVTVTLITQWLSIAHSLFDPVIYCFGSKNFKFTDIFYELKRLSIFRFVRYSFHRLGLILGLAHETSQNSQGSYSSRPNMSFRGRSSCEMTSLTEITENSNRDSIAMSTLNGDGNTSVKVLSATPSPDGQQQANLSNDISHVVRILEGRVKLHRQHIKISKAH